MSSPPPTSTRLGCSWGGSAKVPLPHHLNTPCSHPPNPNPTHPHPLPSPAHPGAFSCLLTRAPFPTSHPHPLPQQPGAGVVVPASLTDSEPRPRHSDSSTPHSPDVAPRRIPAPPKLPTQHPAPGNAIQGQAEHLHTPCPHALARWDLGSNRLPWRTGVGRPRFASRSPLTTPGGKRNGSPRSPTSGALWRTVEQWSSTFFATFPQWFRGHFPEWRRWSMIWTPPHLRAHALPHPVKVLHVLHSWSKC